MTVEMASEELETALSARRYMYAALQSLFGNEPSSERLQAISLPLLREASAVLGIGGADELSEAIEIASTDLEKLKGEYTRLFIGPNELPAPLWESVYVTKERILFHRRTLEVRNFYRSEGLIPQMYPSVADDHIALELDFSARGSMRSLKVWPGAGRGICIPQRADCSRRSSTLMKRFSKVCSGSVLVRTA